MLIPIITRFHQTFTGHLSKYMFYNGFFIGSLPLLKDTILGNSYNYKDCLKLTALFSVSGYFWFITYPVATARVLTDIYHK